MLSCVTCPDRAIPGPCLPLGAVRARAPPAAADRLAAQGHFSREEVDLAHQQERAPFRPPPARSSQRAQRRSATDGHGQRQLRHPRPRGAAAFISVDKECWIRDLAGWSRIPLRTTLCSQPKQTRPRASGRFGRSWQTLAGNTTTPRTSGSTMFKQFSAEQTLSTASRSLHVRECLQRSTSPGIDQSTRTEFQGHFDFRIAPSPPETVSSTGIDPAHQQPPTAGPPAAGEGRIVFSVLLDLLPTHTPRWSL
jgi:hypothetical protein